ncbi:MAG: aminoglycoside phosphotransferase family protein [Spirochaetaceae bacterium]|nr:aminoglycoside phosphotransferase family protein [Spirochaetaceae bacterium]
MTFDGTQKTIGYGAQAEVLLYHGFAYKVYKSSYPAEWIAFEKEQQKAVNTAGLCPVKYYDTDDTHIIKMDFVEGDTLEKKMRDMMIAKAELSKVTEGFDILARAFRFVHQADTTGTTIPNLIDTAGMGLSEEEKAVVLPTIEHLSKKFSSCICHLDMHFLNLMLVPGKTDFTIIDWMNARLAPPVFDYARTYVIFNEFAKDALELYRNAVRQDILELGISDEDFAAAVKVCTILREHEK